MGSFSSTCMVSNIGIGPNDPIVMLRIAKRIRPDETGFDWRNTPGVNMLYPGEDWSPIGLPFFGHYDDYGRIEAVEETPAVAFTLQWINAARVDPLSSVDAYTLEDLCDREIDGHIISIEGRAHVIARTFIHRRIWDHFVGEIEFESYDRETYKRILHKGPERMRAYLQKEVDKIALAKDRMKGMDLRGAKPEVFEALSSMSTYELSQAIRGGEGERNHFGMNLYDQNPDLFLAEYPVMMAFRASLGLMRRSYLPVQTIGEQYDDYRRQKRFFEVCLELIAPTIAEMDAEEGDDAEESTA